jgi:hypothetical protein
MHEVRLSVTYTSAVLSKNLLYFSALCPRVMHKFGQAVESPLLKADDPLSQGEQNIENILQGFIPKHNLRIGFL